MWTRTTLLEQAGPCDLAQKPSMNFDLAIVLLMLAVAVAMFAANRLRMGDASPRLVLATLVVIHSFFGLLIANTATTVLMAPVVVAIAKDLGASPYPFAMVIALAASTAFMTPISSLVNTSWSVPGNTALAIS